ncbi:MAG TPA: metallophosphoesterase [Jatrophihabitans sp.]|nr:metallophosphoesterase [Jatrophihabitans sp.]
MTVERGITRRRALGLGAAAAFLAAAETMRRSPLAEAEAASAEPASFTFVSVPDFFNSDVADLSGSANWRPGRPNSINDAWTQAIDVCLGEVVAEYPDAVFVAGDLVEGWWDHDDTNDQLFGPVGTDDEKLAAIRTAGDQYYTYWKSLWSQRGLPVYPAVGDHEIGDDRLTSRPVNQRWPAGSFRLQAVPTFKQTWANAFPMAGLPHPVGTGAAGTAYAADFPGLRLVTVDMFTVTPTGVRLSVRHGQLKWLERMITSATTPVIVQGHVPVLWPVRRQHSGGLHVPAADGSAFWTMLRKHRDQVPLFLCGEVHDITAIADPLGPVQISHGCLFQYGFNYLVGHVAGATITLESRMVELVLRDATSTLWGVAEVKRPAALIEYATGGAVTVGTMTVQDGAVTERSGTLDVASELGWTY